MAKTQAMKKPNKLTKPTARGSVIALKKKKITNKSLLKKKKEINDKQIWRKPRGGKGVVYLSHIPHGFYEEQIEKYFKQFGKVTAVSLPRSKTGKSKGYAFIEFQHPEVAQIAADTMNNYLMFNRVLKAKYIPPSEQKPRYFLVARAAKLTHKTVPEKAEQKIIKMRKMNNRHLKIDLEAKLAAKLLRKSKKLKQKLQKLGLDYDFEINTANVESIFEKRNEIKKRKESEGLVSEDEDIPSEEEDEELSSLEGNDLSSFEDMDLSDLEDKKKTKKKNKAHKKPKDGTKKNENQKDKQILLSVKNNQKYAQKLTKNKSANNETKTLFTIATYTKQNFKQKLKTTEKEKQEPTLKSLKQKRKSEEPKENLAKILTVNGINNKEKATSSKEHQKLNKDRKNKDKNKLLLHSLTKKKNKIQKDKERKLNTLKAKQLTLFENKLKLAKESLTSSKNINEKRIHSTTVDSRDASKMKPKEDKTLKQIKKHQIIVKTPLPKHKRGVHTQGKSLDITPKLVKYVMEVDENDAEINFKTPPGVTKTFLNNKKDSVKKTPKQKKSKSPTLNVYKNVSHSGTITPKKPRHRALKKKSVC